ncbi:extracellular serine/threonine protein kinase FAM20C [Biomphalaria pfeifferi]|uniref:Extracellular serine/threonine protein kinase FAM20C n=1 Tax=Biomphalaria pfeifferi TaxID=112525 RepID=A0AAD8F3L9_BIOPF|nr:extracellular serine/threonine protein kinase FAM20C [Biomphalaria pfeifferi]
MGYWTYARRRWKWFLWLLVTAVVLINAAIFIGLTGPRDQLSVRQMEDESHLLIARKRLNKSRGNSSGQAYADWEQKDPLGGDRGKHLNQENSQKQDQNLADHGYDANQPKEVDANYNSRTNYTYKDNEEDNDDEEIIELLKEKDDQEDYVQQKGGQSHGARANYSITQVDQFVQKFQSVYKNSPYAVDTESKYLIHLRRITSLRKKGPRLVDYLHEKCTHSWEIFHSEIRQHALYDPDEGYLKSLLKDMVMKEVVDVEQKEGGTQIKLIITLEDDGQSLFKPMRFPREQETLPDHFYFADYERHNAEIAAFHLDMLLGFHRVPPTVGRVVNVSHDLHRLSNKKLARTFFLSPAGNWCFHGSCSYYCDSSHPICGHPIMLEGSMAAFLPPVERAKRKTWRNPWKRSYSKHRKAYWELNNDLCDKIKEKEPYNTGRRLLDILDMAVFDFLTGNLDRHHYETFQDFDNETFLLHLDNGRAFGKSKYDCISCIAPVRQCCMIRLSTLSKLVKLYSGPDSLSTLMRFSMHSDPVDPILVESHLQALDRRVSKLLHIILSCLAKGKSWNEVIIDDGIT